MAIQDLYKNLLNMAQSIDTFLGYQPTDEELTEFPYEIYKFVMKSIREQDQNSKVGGTKLLERYLLGPQAVWVTLWQKVNELRDTLFDPNEIDIKFLRGLSKLLGWGDDLIDVWTVATDDQKRKLVIGAIAFWKYRWLYGGLEVAIRLVTGNRFKIRGYFDFRWVLGENMLFEELQNLDIHLLSLDAISQFQQGVDGETQYSASVKRFRSASGNFTAADVGAFVVIQTVGAASNGVYKILTVQSAEIVDVEMVFPAAETDLAWFTAYHYDEFITEIRLVDDVTGSGAVNRELLAKLLELQRAMSERLNILYVTFLDLFQTNNDLFQWGEPVGTMTAVVADGVLKLDGTNGHLPTSYYQDDDWSHYTATIKAALQVDGIFEILFNYQDEDNTYRLQIKRDGFGTGEIKLFKTVVGTPIQIGTTYPFPSLAPNVYWTYRIHAHQIEGGTKTAIRVELDGDQIFDEEDTSFTKGKIALGTQSKTGVFPPDLIVLAHFNDTTPSFDLDYARDGGSLTASINGSPTIDATSPKFGAGNLLLNDVEWLEYADTGLVSGLVQTGCISFWMKPNYSGAPGVHQLMYFSASPGGDANYIDILHLSTSNLRFYLKTSAGVNIFTIQAAWLPTAGTWYHIEANYDITTGASRLFVNGTQHSTTATATGTRTATSEVFRIGKTTLTTAQNHHLDELQIYDAVQHTAGFTPPTSELVGGSAETSKVWFDEVELWQYPMDLERVGPYP